jgi:deoxyribose-phosphate aldolase
MGRWRGAKRRDGCLDISVVPREDLSMPSLSVVDVSYEQLAKTIDHSLLRPELTLEEVKKGCELAARYQVASVCVRPADVVVCAEVLAESEVAVGTVIGFPHGSHTTETKVFEAERALADGASELDMVINIGWLRSGEDERVEADIRAVVDTAGGRALVKVILENAYLDRNQKVRGSKLVEQAGADFVKTSTGFAPSGATIDDLKLMRASVSPSIQIKAAGGVRSLDSLLEVMSVGVTRVGATRTAEILDDYRMRA